MFSSGCICKCHSPTPCDSKGLVVDPGPLIWNWQLVFAEQRLTLPGEDGIIIEAAEDGVTQRKEEDLGNKTPHSNSRNQSCMVHRDYKKMKCHIGKLNNLTLCIPTDWRTLSFLFLWKVSRSQSWAVSADVVMAYLPEPWTETEDMAPSWPRIQLTSCLVSDKKKRINSLLRLGTVEYTV